MKKNQYTAYDMIRQDKFKTPEKIRKVENLLKENDVVVNWWCRQSGKTLTSVKIVRDFAISKPNSLVIVISPQKSSAAQWLDLMRRVIDRKNVHSHTSNSIRIDNGSLIKITSSSTSIKDADMVIVDEFDYVDSHILGPIVRQARFNAQLTLVDKILNFFRKTNKCKFLFSSSSNNGENFRLIKQTLPGCKINYLNWDNLKIDFSLIKDVIGDDEFKREYDSYKP